MLHNPEAQPSTDALAALDEQVERLLLCSEGTIGTLGTVGSGFWAETKCDIRDTIMPEEDDLTHHEHKTVSLYIPHNLRFQPNGSPACDYIAKMSLFSNGIQYLAMFEDGSVRHDFARNYAEILMAAQEHIPDLPAPIGTLIQLGSQALAETTENLRNVYHWFEKGRVSDEEFSSLYADVEAEARIHNPVTSYKMRYKITHTDGSLPAGYSVQATGTLPAADGSRKPEEDHFHKYTGVTHPGSGGQEPFRYNRVAFFAEAPATEYIDRAHTPLPVTDERLAPVTASIKCAADAALEDEFRRI